MEQLNRIELRGAIGSVKTQTYSDNLMSRFTIATNYAYKDKEGAAVIDTSWHNVIAWQNKNMPDLTELKKGNKVYVQGRLRYQRYTGADGMERVSAEVFANKIVILTGDEPLQYEM